jgi:hypothetical protein
MQESKDNSVRYYEEVLRKLDDIVALLRENNTMLKEHSRTVETINDRVRRIGVNTSHIR